MTKTKRLSDKEALAKVRGSPCVICKKPSDPCHIKSKGSGGHDTEDGLIALCRWHHSEQHYCGWPSFVATYPVVGFVLRKKGWVFEKRFGVIKLVRE